MNLNIDLNSIKNGALAAYHSAAAKASEWFGHGIAVLKSGTETALPYLQDRRIAVISLIAANLILIEIGDFFSGLVGRRLPNKTEGQKAFREAFEIGVGLGTVIGGVGAFAQYTKLPLSWLAITGISVGTVLVRASFTKDVE